MEIPAKQGSYLILAKLTKKTEICSGPFCGKYLNEGIYFYSGSAFGPGGLKARVGRHLKTGAKKYWHFDYIKEIIDIFEIWFSIGNEKKECEFVIHLQEIDFSTIPFTRFGSSDCHINCPAHLVKFPLDVNIQSVYNLLFLEDTSLRRAKLHKSDRIDS